MENKTLIKTISYDIVNNYVQGWHEVAENCPTMFNNVYELNAETDTELQEKLQHFNDNYYAYKQVGGSLVFDECRVGWDKVVCNAKIAIQELTAKLIGMDYKTSKNADGDYTKEEWQAIVSERKAIRAQIRDNEEVIIS